MFRPSRNPRPQSYTLMSCQIASGSRPLMTIMIENQSPRRARINPELREDIAGKTNQIRLLSSYLFRIIVACISTRICIYIYMYACMYACLYACMFAWMSVCLSACLPACLPARLPVCLSVWLCTYVCNYVRMYKVRMHVSILVCMNVCTHVRTMFHAVSNNALLMLLMMLMIRRSVCQYAHQTESLNSVQHRIHSSHMRDHLSRILN